MAGVDNSDKAAFIGHNLIGFVPLRPDTASVRNKWDRAALHIKGLTVSEANIADSPDIKPLPDELDALKAELMGRQSFQHAFSQAWRVDVNMVNLEQIVVYQEFINLPYAEEVSQRLGQVTDLKSLFQFCMDPPTETVEIVHDQDSWPIGVMTASREHRLIDIRCLAPDEIQLTSPNATPLKDYATTHFLVSFGFTPNFLSAYLVENRLILRNGTHRAYALLKDGRRHVPCVVRQVTRQNFLQAAGIIPDQLPIYLENARPPMLKDYLNKELIVAGRAPELPKTCLYLHVAERRIALEKVRTTYLQMFANPQRVVPPPREGLAVLHARKPTLAYYRFLYDAVGRDYDWTNRKNLSDAELSVIIHDPRNEIHVLMADGVPAGFAELDRRTENEIELVQFGLVPEFIGQGLGRYFLQWIIDKAWSYSPMRFWLHTCTRHHPVALPNFLKAGFAIYKEEGGD